MGLELPSESVNLVSAFGVGSCGQSIYVVLRPMSEKLFVRWNLFLFSSVLLIVVLSRSHSIYHLFHALNMLWSYVQSSLTTVFTVTNESGFCLLVRARVAIGIKRIERMPYRELIRLHGSHAPLLYLETSRQVSGNNKLSLIMKDASLSDLSFLYSASDIISGHVEQVLSQNFKYVKMERWWKKTSCKYNEEYFDDLTIERFQFILLVLSLFESTREDIGTIILYGVPGLPSVSLSRNSTYADIRSLIIRTTTHLRDFYFVARAKIIQIEDTAIDWGSGHLVLNVHTSGDLPGGSMQSSSKDERKVRNSNKQFHLQGILQSDASDDDGFDDSISDGISESDSLQDSDSSWDGMKKNKRYQRAKYLDLLKCPNQTQHEQPGQNNHDVPQLLVSDDGDSGSDDSLSPVISGSDSSQDSASSCDFQRKKKHDRNRCHSKKNKGVDPTHYEDQRRGTDLIQNELLVQNNREAQQLSVTAESGEDGSDDSISTGISGSESFQDSDSSWDFQKMKKQN